jgi:phospholipase C
MTKARRRKKSAGPRKRRKTAPPRSAKPSAPRSARSAAGRLVVIDPGHGGTQSVGGSSPNNATGPAGLLEKAVTLDVARRAAAALTALGHQVRLTRSEDVNLGLAARAAVAKAAGAPVFVSIHFNGDEDDRTQGTETWVHTLASQASHDLAQWMQRHVVVATGYRDRQVKRARFGVLDPRWHDSSTAACLLEVSFLTDPTEEQRLGQATYLDALGRAIAAGVTTYLADVEAKTRPSPAMRAVRSRAAAARSVSDGIKHVVVLMLENRSFDHMVGSLREVFPKLDGIDPSNPGRNIDPREPTVPYFQKPTSTTALPKDPKHDLANVRYQLDSALGRCGGFVDDFRRAYDTPRDVTQEVMAYYDFGDLPALHRLASEFTICDHWFSSVPGPTWTNRLFAHSGTSLGRVEMPTPPFNLQLSRYNQTTLYDRLNEQGISWGIYYGDVPQSLILEHQRSPKNAIRYRRFAGGPFTDSFEEAAAGPADDFPQFVFIEPSYFLQQNDQHPPSDVMHGDILIARIYNALRRNETLWKETLLVILYDEHGGFYDHVFPGPAVPPDSHAEEYTFDQFGVRVPAILISPWVGRGPFAVELDHTSLLRYLTDKWQLGSLGARTAAANSFADVILKKPRAYTLPPFPEPDVPLGRAALVTPIAPPGLNDLQRALVGLTDVLERQTIEPAEVRVARAARMLDGTTIQADVAMERVERFLAEQRRTVSERKA